MKKVKLFKGFVGFQEVQQEVSKNHWLQTLRRLIYKNIQHGFLLIASLFVF
jgi:hypothetical protein